jgi:hypothetical protein
MSWGKDTYIMSEHTADISCVVIIVTTAKQSFLQSFVNCLSPSLHNKFREEVNYVWFIAQGLRRQTHSKYLLNKWRVINQTYIGLFAYFVPPSRLNSILNLQTHQPPHISISEAPPHGYFTSLFMLLWSESRPQIQSKKNYILWFLLCFPIFILV